MKAKSPDRRWIGLLLVPLALIAVSCAGTEGSADTSGTTSPVTTTTTQSMMVACPASGFTIGAGGRDGAMGLRTDALLLNNCGRSALVFQGYPAVRLVGSPARADGTAPTISATPGVASIDIGDPKPTSVSLPPGGTASAVLSWRNTATDGEPVRGKSVDVVARTGDERLTVAMEVDLGTTGKLFVTAWRLEAPS